MTPRQKYNALLAQKVIKELGNRNIQGFYCETKKEALEKVLQMIPKGSVVSWGGSETLGEVGLTDAIKNGEYKVLDPRAEKSGVEMDRVAHHALNADYYLMSANAISATGELVNMDGIGNRVASLSYGPKHIIMVAGINKVEQSLDAAVARAKTVAAPLCVLPHSKSEPVSFDDLIDKARVAASQLMITTMSTFRDRIKVVIVGESLGF
ncbi:MAG TPA: lactate utilization protein [Chitinivibrionales bacterium]|nr:lactate utilization protein [Chitinivibrionales bacterium]